GDMPLVQVWRRNPRPKVSCPGLSGQSARGAKPTQYCDHDGAPKQRLHGSLDTAGLRQQFQLGTRGPAVLTGLFFRVDRFDVGAVFLGDALALDLHARRELIADDELGIEDAPLLDL